MGQNAAPVALQVPNAQILLGLASMAFSALVLIVIGTLRIVIIAETKHDDPALSALFVATVTSFVGGSALEAVGKYRGSSS